MRKLILAKQNMLAALATLEQAIEQNEKIKMLDEHVLLVLGYKADIEKSLQDSLIQRFEFCTDLFWKYLKRYEEEAYFLTLDEISPRSVITTACKAKIISEPDAELLLEMVKDRNFTSHTYKAEIAAQIGARVPQYYTVIKKYVDALVIPKN